MYYSFDLKNFHEPIVKIVTFSDFVYCFPVDNLGQVVWPSPPPNLLSIYCVLDTILSILLISFSQLSEMVIPIYR